jgi:excisionase family DNA binding protein
MTKMMENDGMRTTEIDRRTARTFCTTREAAKLLGVSVSTAQVWTESGLLEAWKTEGGHRRILRESVLRLLANPRTHQAVVKQVLSHPVPANVLKILVVEDDDLLRRMYEIRLATWKCRPIVRSAANGFDALVRIGMELPDLLITDLAMPNMDGFEMLRSLVRLAECSTMRIAVVTGLEPAEIERAGGLPPSVRVFGKPVPFAALEEIAETALENGGRFVAGGSQP